MFQRIVAIPSTTLTVVVARTDGLEVSNAYGWWILIRIWLRGDILILHDDTVGGLLLNGERCGRYHDDINAREQRDKHAADASHGLFLLVIILLLGWLTTTSRVIVLLLL